MSKHTRPSGFTLIELLAVIALILLLMSLLLPVIGAAREKGYRIVCASNMRQLQLGATRYASDQDGRLPGSGTGVHPDVDWIVMNIATDTLQSVTNGSIWKYVVDERVYRCPTHPFKDYIRTYSMNNFLNGQGGWGWDSNLTARTMGMVPQPASTISFIEEPDPRKYLMGSWIVYADTGNINGWVDPVGFWHQDGCNMGFVDGHVEYWKWQDARTLLIEYAFFITTPNNPDLYRVKRHVAPGAPGYEALNNALKLLP
jgi:prepilin-type N-terminal cleavage/methylation domain-containing protein/prepilin-type processing-associated H-X9-DG protein